MKNLFFIILFLPCAFLAHAQKSMYLYFESENQLPFYLKIDEKVYTSVFPGYFVLTGLEQGKHKVSVGIPSESRLENRFEISVERDRGLLIQKQGKELVLHDMHDGTSVRLNKDPSMPEIIYEPRTDNFTLLLSKATGDPGLLMSPVFAKAEPKTLKTEPAAVVFKEVEPANKKQEVVAGTNPPVASTKTNSEEAKKEIGTSSSDNKEKTSGTNENIAERTEKDSVNAESGKDGDSAQTLKVEQLKPRPSELKSEENALAFKRSVVSKFAEGSSSEGFRLVFIDEVEGIQDTIRLLIPNPKFNLEGESKEITDTRFLELKEEKEAKKKIIPADSVTGKPEASPSAKKEVVVIDSINQTSYKEAEMQNSSTISKEPLATTSQKNNCKEIASENDFFKLRKNMASKMTDEAMVAEAKKYFKTRCFLTEQIRNLSSLFLTSAGKYLFFDASYLHVSDVEQFASLQEEIKDEYYKKRFNALIGL